jgi:hypothetical protein
MMVIVAVATVLFVTASSWPLCRRARREWRERRLTRAEVARGIAGLETMLAAHAARAGRQPGYREGKGTPGENAPKP